MNYKGKKVLILGNGFDLAHGLPTRYSDFLEFCTNLNNIYKYYIKPKIYGYKKNIDKFQINELIKDELLEAFKTRKVDIKEKDGVCSYIFKSENTAIQNIYECLNGNIWFEYFNKIYSDNIIIGENWIDFESEISFIIQFFDREIANLMVSYDDIKKIVNKKENEKVEVFFKLLETSYKTSDHQSRHIDDEITKAKDLRKRCFEDLERITRALEIYLAHFVDKISVNERLHCIEKLNPDYVINFNYTNTYERIYNNAKEVFYIHGKCNEEGSVETNNLVLGIDEYWPEEECDKHTDYTIFKKFAQRIRKKNGIENQKYLIEIEDIYKKYSKIPNDSAEENIEKSDGITEVYIFGHSLDVTDKDILADFLNNEATTVKIFFKDKETEGELIANVIKIIGEKTLLKKVNEVPPKIEFMNQNEKVN